MSSPHRIGFLFGLALAFAAAGTAGARTLTVAADGSADYRSIQAAIQAAVGGDTVEVGPGRYRERLHFGGRAIVVRSTHGPTATHIDARGEGSVVVMDLLEGPGTVLDGFTLRGGTGTPLRAGTEPGAWGHLPPPPAAAGRGDVRMYPGAIGRGEAPDHPAAPGRGDARQYPDAAGGAAGRLSGEAELDGRGRFGGGILLLTAAPTLRRLILADNTANYGGGIYALQLSPSIADCRFLRNTAGVGAGAFLEMTDRPVLERCEFQQNSGVFGGGIALYAGGAEVRDCRFTGNEGAEGGALRLLDCSAATRVVRCLFWRNVAGEGSLVHARGSLLELESCTAMDNGQTGADPAAVYLDPPSAGFVRRTIFARTRAARPVTAGPGVEVSCCDIWPGAPGVEPEGDNFSAPPGFCAPEAGDFRLEASSPCLPEHTPPGCGLVGAYDVGCRP